MDELMVGDGDGDGDGDGGGMHEQMRNPLCYSLARNNYSQALQHPTMFCLVPSLLCLSLDLGRSPLPNDISSPYLPAHLFI